MKILSTSIRTESQIGTLILWRRILVKLSLGWRWERLLYNAGSGSLSSFFCGWGHIILDLSLEKFLLLLFIICLKNICRKHAKKTTDGIMSIPGARFFQSRYNTKTFVFFAPPPPQFENLNVGRSQKISSVITFNFT